MNDVTLVCPVCSSTFTRKPYHLKKKIGKVRVCSLKCRNVLGLNARRKNYEKTFKDRFWARVDKGEACWEWQGGTTSAGYGTVRRGGHNLQTHRVAYELHYEEAIPEGMYVLHDCDNRKCVKPDHLRVGTAKDNGEDAARRNRFPVRCGEANANSKLSDEDVTMVRSLYKTGEYTQVELAKRFGINQTHVSRLVNGRMR